MDKLNEERPEQGFISEFAPKPPETSLSIVLKMHGPKIIKIKDWLKYQRLINEWNRKKSRTPS